MSRQGLLAWRRRNRETKHFDFYIRASRFNMSRGSSSFSRREWSLSLPSDGQRIDLLKILSKAVRSLCSEI